MATVSTRHYMRPRKGRSGFDLLQASDAPEDEKRLGLEGYKPSDPDTAKAAVGYNSRGFAQGEDAYRLGLKDRPVEVGIGTPTTLWRKEQPKDEDWGDGKRGGATGATGRELDEAGMLGTGPDVEVGIGTPSLVRRGALEQDWMDGKMSGASNPKARGARPGITVGASSKAPGDADYLSRLKDSATLPGKAETPFSDAELSVMFEGTGGSGTPEDEDPALAAAQAQGREASLAAAIGRAGAHLNEGLTGAKYDRTAYDGYAANADRPVGDLLQRRKAVGERQGRARTAQQDRMRAEEHARQYARQQQQDARQASNDAYGRERDAKGDARQAARDAEDARRFALTRQDAAAARAATRGAANGRQAEKDEAARLKAQAAADADAVKRGEKLGQATSKAPYGDLQSALSALDGLSPGIIYGDAPEENPIPFKDRALNHVPMGAGERFMGDKSLKYKSELQNLRDLISRLRSGAALNQSEEAHYLSLLGDDILSDPRRAAAGINAVRRGIGQKLRDAQAAYAGPVLDNYEREGGTTYRNPVFSGQGRQSAAAPPVRMQSPDGRQYTVDPSEVDEAKRNGWRAL